MKKRKYLSCVLLFAIFIASFVSCNQGKGHTTPNSTPTPNPTPTPTPNPPGPNPPTPSIEMYYHLTEIMIWSGRENGFQTRTEIQDEKLESILKGKVDEIEVLGVHHDVYFCSVAHRFEKITVNGQDITAKMIPDHDTYISLVNYQVNLLELKQMVLSFEILAEGGKKSKGKIKLIRKQQKADIPLTELFLNNKKINIKGRDIIQDMSDDGYVTSIDKILENGKLKIQVCSLLEVIKEAKFNDGSPVKPVKKQIGDRFFNSVVEKTIEDVKPNTEIKVEIFPINDELLNPVTWKFTIED